LKLVDELPKQNKMKAKSLTKWILTNANKTLYLDKNNLLHINGQTGDHLIDYVRYVTSPLKIKKEPSYLKQFYIILKCKNIPKYYLVQDVKTPYVLSKLSLSKLPGTKRITKWEKLR
jgi:hypothetical protein